LARQPHHSPGESAVREHQSAHPNSTAAQTKSCFTPEAFWLLSIALGAVVGLAKLLPMIADYLSYETVTQELFCCSNSVQRACFLGFP